MSVDFAKMQEIFLAAVERRRPDDRQAYLDQACASDEEMRRQVEMLLKAHEEAGSVPGAQTDESDPTGAYDTAAETAGMVIGPYKLIEQIGEGGMGTVWMAQQTDPVKRLVAVKLIKAGMDSRQVIARFEAERQALALMDHAHIARVLDAGTTPNGRPYFVMDLVKGVPITRYCDEHHLTPRQRLELFIPVCQAVQHAHQKGIIHRDLKPSNVLVALYDGKPVPKVIDFGVAKAAGQQLTDKTLVTGFGHLVGTLEYMSPEQAEVNQLDIDTRSDIYSLGVLLYELLAGSPPFSRKELEQAGMLEMLRVIREQEPSKPSTKLSTAKGLPTLAANRGMEPAKLTKLVRGELDWIVMKALEKDRNRRYETANGFAMDVQRYLADEPVLACPPSAAYRLKKFARRNRGGLAVAALVLFFLVLLGSGIGWVVRDRSARNARVAGLVELILAEVDRLEKEQKWPEALAAARRAEAAVTGGEADAETAMRIRQRLKDLEFIDRLEQIRVQRATLVQGHFDNAGVRREYARAFRDYGVDVEELPVETSIDRLKTRPTLVIPLASALDDWSVHLSPSDSARWKRLVAVARGIDPEPLRDRLRAARGRPASEAQGELLRLAESIDVRAQHAATLYVLAHNLERVKHPDAAVRLLRDAQYAYPGDFWLNCRLAEALGNQEDREGAIRYYTAAVSIRPRAAAALNNLGNALRGQKKLDEAIVVYRQAIEIDPIFAYAYDGLGNALCDQKKRDESIAAYRKAIELDPKGAAPYHNLGRALAQQKKLDEASAAFRTAIALGPEYAGAYIGLGNVLGDQKKLDEAIACFRKAIALDPKKGAYAYLGLGNALRGQKKLDEAIAAYRKAIELDPKDALAYGNLGRLLCDDLRDYDKACDYCRQAIELDPKDPNGHVNLGIALRGQKKLDEAIAACRKAIELDPKFAYAYNALGNALIAQKKPDEAIAAFHRAIELDPKYALAYRNLGRLLCDDLRDYDKACDYCRQAIELDPKDPNGHVNLGIALCGQKKLDEAIAACRKAIELDPKFAYAYNALGNVLIAQKKPDEAVAAYHRAIELDPKYAIAYCNLGALLCHDRKDFGKAIECFRRAIELDSKYADAYYNLGHALAQQRKLDEASAAFRTAIELGPEYAGAYIGLGNVLRDQKKLDEAIAAYRKAIQIDPKSAAPYNNLGALLCDDLKDYGKAVECFRKATELDRRDAKAHDNLGKALRGQKKLDEAIAAHRKAIGIDPNFANAYNGLAWLLATCPDAKFRDPKQAVALAKKAIELAPTHPGFPNTLGAAHYRAGDWKAAIAALEKSMELRKGGDSNDWFLLAMTHWQLGEKDKARDWYDRAVQWMDKNQPTDEDLRRFRAEAAELLGVKEEK